MLISEIMTPMVSTVGAEDTVTRAAKRMNEQNIGFLPVLDGAKLVGVVSDRDIVVRGVVNMLNPTITAVRQIMTPEPVWCRPDDPVETAARLMEEMKVRRILVVDNKGCPMGVVSLGDMATRIKENDLAGEILEKVAETS